MCVCVCVSLTESSAGVAEQLQSTRQIAEELIEVQNTALQAQQEILNNGEELRVTLRDSTQGNTDTLRLTNTWHALRQLTAICLLLLRSALHLLRAQ